MKTRIISAIVALIIAIPILIIGEWPFKIAVAILGVIGLHELLKLKEKEKKLPTLIKVITLLSFLALVLSNTGFNNNFMVDYKIITAIIFLSLIPLVFYHNNKKYNISDALYVMGVVFFLGVAFNFLIIVRDFDLNYLIFLLLITIFTDTFAYVTGLLIGKHKMIPSVSPKKTWEGCIGGTVIGTFISTMFYVNVFGFTGNIFILILIVMFLSIIGQMGDLVFSSIKRNYATKDFGNIMPGHGGVLDRLDSILFVLLAFSFIIPYL